MCEQIKRWTSAVCQDLSTRATMSTQISAFVSHYWDLFQKMYYKSEGCFSVHFEKVSMHCLFFVGVPSVVLIVWVLTRQFYDNRGYVTSSTLKLSWIWTKLTLFPFLMHILIVCILSISSNTIWLFFKVRFDR